MHLAFSDPPDDQVVALWLHGRPAETQRAYRREADRFRAFVAKPLAAITLGDVQAYADTLVALAPASQGRALGAVKSLLAFAHRLGYLPFDVGRAVRAPSRRDSLAQRILSEADVHRLLALEPDPRNRILLRFLYASGVRVSEAVGVCWTDMTIRDEGGQVTVHGKGGKTRHILLPPSIWRELITLRGDAGGAAAPLFRSQRGGHLHPSQVLRIVKAAARRAGLSGAESPHWLRHAHASHALDRGAPIHLVQATLGHASVATTGRYTHARPSDSSARYLAL
ncbi:MAG: tyrosine-type recombinase/integrase [Thermomicrobiales bacterium]